MTPNPQADFNFPQNNAIFRSPAFRIEQTVCEALNADPVLSACGVLSLPLDSLNIEYEIKNAVSKQGIVGVVGIDELQYIGHNGTDSFYDATINLQVTEQPTINRARASEGKTTKTVELTCFYEGITGEEGAKREYRKYIVPKRSNFDVTSLSNTLSSFEGGIMQIVDSANPEFPDFAFCSLQCHNWSDVYAGFEYKKESGNDYFELMNTDSAGVTMTEYEDFYIAEPDRDDVLVYPDAWADASVFKCYTFNIVSTVIAPKYACTALEAAIQGTDILSDPDSTVLSGFGTFCPNGGVKTSNTNAFVTAVSKIKASVAFPKNNI